jgi:hypothetical protein
MLLHVLLVRLFNHLDEWLVPMRKLMVPLKYPFNVNDWGDQTKWAWSSIYLSSSSFLSGLYAGDVGEYAGDVGLYAGDVGE